MEIEPESKILFNLDNIGYSETFNHIHSSIDGNVPPLFTLLPLCKPPRTSDIALIQCFFGTDEDRIQASTLALLFMSLSNPKPEEWVFVEAQKSESDAKFRWLSQYGAKYIFVKIRSERENYFIKEQLWNIGARNSNAKFLAFVDSDVAYSNADWLDRVAEKFSWGIRVIQPHAWSWLASCGRLGINGNQ